MNYRFIGPQMFLVNNRGYGIDNPNPHSGVIVKNVQKESGNMFTSKQYSYEYNGEKYITSYAWALVEDTPDNIDILTKLSKLREQQKTLEEQVKEIRDKLKLVQ